MVVSSVVVVVVVLVASGELLVGSSELLVGTLVVSWLLVGRGSLVSPPVVWGSVGGALEDGCSEVEVSDCDPSVLEAECVSEPGLDVSGPFDEGETLVIVPVVAPVSVSSDVGARDEPSVVAELPEAVAGDWADSVDPALALCSPGKKVSDGAPLPKPASTTLLTAASRSADLSGSGSGSSIHPVNNPPKHKGAAR